MLILSVSATGVSQTQTGSTTGTALQILGLGDLRGTTVSLDGKRALTWGGAGAVVWDLQTSTPIRRFTKHTAAVLSAAFSPDGNKIVTGSTDRSGILWDVNTGLALKTFTHTASVNKVFFTPDGLNAVSASSDGTVRVWRISDGVLLNNFNTGTAALSAAISPDGTVIASIHADHKARLWRFGIGTPTVLNGHTGDLTDVQFSPDSSRVVTAAKDPSLNIDFTARSWDVQTGTQLQVFTHASNVLCASFSPDNSRILTACEDGTARVWNANSSAAPITVLSAGAYLKKAVWSPAGTFIATAGGDAVSPPINYQIKLYEAQTYAPAGTLSGHKSEIVDLGFYANDARLITTGGDAKIWSPEAGVNSANLTGHTLAVNESVYSPGGSFVVTGGDDNVARLWNGQTGTLQTTLGGHTAPVKSVAVSTNSLLVATGSADQTAKLWNAQTGELLRTFNLAGFVTSVAFSPTAQLLATADGITAKTWNTQTGALDRTFTPAGTSFDTVLISPNGQILATLNGNFIPGNLDLWNIATGAHIATLGANDIGCAAFSADSSRIAIGRVSGSAAVYTVAGAAVSAIAGHPSQVLGISFSPDGMFVATASMDKTAKVWTAASGALAITFSGHTDWVRRVEFSADGSRLATSSFDKTAVLWSLVSGTAVRQFAGHANTPTSLELSPDGRRLLTASADGTARLWELTPPRVLIVAGGGNYAGNGIAQQTDDLVAYTYRILKDRGYPASDIQYLSAFPSRDSDGDGLLNDVDTTSSLANLQSALTGSFASATGRLLVIMLDHGYRTGGFMAYRMNSTEAVTSVQLRTWLDDLQTTSVGHPVAPDVTCVIDCCYAGQMADDLTRNLAAGITRKVLASTTSTAEAVFLPSPDLSSFTYSFLTSAYMGNSFGESFRAGERFFQVFPVANQAPQVRTFDPATTASVEHEFLGANWSYGVQTGGDVSQFFPAFEAWTSNTVITPGAQVTLEAKLLANQNPTSVSCAVRQPAPNVISGDPVTTMPKIALARVSNVTTSPDFLVWRAIAPAADFDTTGPYTLSFTATFANERVSAPALGSLSIGNFPDPDPAPIRGVLGIGRSADASVDSAIQSISQFAYSVFFDRFHDAFGGTHPEWIDYSTPFSDPNRDSLGGSTAILSAIQANASVSGLGRLYIHLLADSSSTGTLRMDAAGTDLLTTTALKSALDIVQTSQPSAAIIISIDAPGSGAFIAPLSAPNRIILASGRAQEGALFLPSPILTSFTQKYLGAALQGATIADSFLAGKTFFRQFLRLFSSQTIQPQIDDNGDGISDPFDGTGLSRQLYFGRRYAFAGDQGAGLPFILDLTTTQTVLAGSPVSISAQLLAGIAPRRVFLQRVAPSAASGDDVITSLPEIELVRRSPSSWYWDTPTTFTAPAEQGIHSIAVYATYDDINTDKTSEPTFTALVVSTDPSTPDRWDAAPRNDDTLTSSDNWLAETDLPQPHTLHDVSDVDYMLLTGAGFDTAMNPVLTIYSVHLSDIELPPGNTLTATLLDTNGTPIAPDEQIASGGGSTLDILWGVTSSRLAAVRIQRSVSMGGSTAGAKYTIRLNRSQGVDNGIISQAGSRVEVGWPQNGGSNITLNRPSQSRRPGPRAFTLAGYEVVRFDSWKAIYGQEVTSTTVSGITPLAPAVGCCCPNIPPVSGLPACQNYQDEPPEPPNAGTGPWLFTYQVFRVETDGAQTQRTLHSYGIVVVRYNGGWEQAVAEGIVSDPAPFCQSCNTTVGNWKLY